MLTQLADGLLEYRTTGCPAVAKAAKSGETVVAAAGTAVDAAGAAVAAAGAAVAAAGAVVALAGAVVALLLLPSPNTGSNTFSTSLNTSSGGGTALILWALPWLAYLSTTGMLSSVKVLNLQGNMSCTSCMVDLSKMRCAYDISLLFWD